MRFYGMLLEPYVIKPYHWLDGPVCVSGMCHCDDAICMAWFFNREPDGGCGLSSSSRAGLCFGWLAFIVNDLGAGLNRHN